MASESGYMPIQQDSCLFGGIDDGHHLVVPGDHPEEVHHLAQSENSWILQHPADLFGTNISTGLFESGG